MVNGKHQIREIDGGGSSHLSQKCTYAHFGIGNATEIDEIIVHWTGGEKQILTNQKVNQTIMITEEKHFAIWLILKWILVALGLLVGGLYFLAKNN